MALTAEQNIYYQLFKTTSTGLGIGQFTLSHRLPEGKTTPNTGGSGGASRNSRFVESSGVRITPNVETYTVWATWAPKELRLGSKDAGDNPAFAGWMKRGSAQMLAFDATGTAFPLQDQDWLTDPSGTLYIIDNPFLDPAGMCWTFNMWTQR